MNSFIFYHKQLPFAARDTGYGRQAVLLLHGFLENQHMWDELIHHFPRHYRLITLDLPGHGQSASLGYIHTMDEMAEVVKSLIRHLQLRRVSLIGHSMGGYIALAFAEKFPGITRNLLLINATARADSDERKESRRRAIELVKQNSESYVRQAIPLLFSPENRRTLPQRVKEAQLQALHTSKQGIIAALEGMRRRPDREVILHFAGFPVRMIASREDPILPLSTAQEQAQNSNIPIHILPGGHLSHLEATEELYSAVYQSLRH